MAALAYKRPSSMPNESIVSYGENCTRRDIVRCMMIAEYLHLSQTDCAITVLLAGSREVVPLLKRGQGRLPTQNDLSLAARDISGVSLNQTNKGTRIGQTRSFRISQLYHYCDVVT